VWFYCFNCCTGVLTSLNSFTISSSSGFRVQLCFLSVFRAKAEESAWLEVANFYNSYRADVLAELDKSSSAYLSSQTPAKARGKRRATEDWEGEMRVREDDLPAVFRGEGIELAKDILVEGVEDTKGEAGEERRKGPLTARLEGLEFKVCLLSFTLYLYELITVSHTHRSIVFIHT